MLFTADTDYHDIEVEDDSFTVPAADEIKVFNGWKSAKDLEIGDIISTDEGPVYLVTKTYNVEENEYKLTVRRAQ
jgi:hypothetical protein